ncbi:MAG: S-adenosylmethionine decarboxylase [archaeon]
MVKEPKHKLTKTYHIIFDARGCNPKRISDEKFVFKLLMDIPKLVDMKILVGPNMVRDYDLDNTGITGIAIISFSHISIHTFDKTGEVFIDVFSCKPFDYDKIRTYLFKALKVPSENVQTQEIKYPWER